MIEFRKAVALSSLAVALLFCGTAVSQAAKDSDVAALHAADAAWEKAYNAGQVDGVVALYDANAVVYPPGVAPIHGGAQIRAFFEKDMADFAKAGLSISLDVKADGGVSGNMGWSSGTWTVKDKAGQVVDSGWYFSVSRRANGKWLYVRDAWNSGKPAVPAAGGE